jgi:hypothetical protein
MTPSEKRSVSGEDATAGGDSRARPGRAERCARVVGACAQALLLAALLLIALGALLSLGGREVLFRYQGF